MMAGKLTGVELQAQVVVAQSPVGVCRGRRIQDGSSNHRSYQSAWNKRCVQHSE